MKIETVILFLFVSAACGFGQTTLATPANRAYTFPPVGLASTETAQINVVTTAAASTGSTGSTAASCSGTITFTDAAGKAIGSPVSFTTTGTEIYSKQLTFTQLGASGTRGEFVASIALNSSATAAQGFCAFNYSLETFDTTTGATHVYLGNPAAAQGAILIPGILR